MTRMDEPFPVPQHILDRLTPVVIGAEGTFLLFTYLICADPEGYASHLYSDPVSNGHYIMMCVGETVDVDPATDRKSLIARVIPRKGSPWENATVDDYQEVMCTRDGKPIQYVIEEARGYPPHKTYTLMAITDPESIEELIPENYRR